MAPDTSPDTLYTQGLLPEEKTVYTNLVLFGGKVASSLPGQVTGEYSVWFPLYYREYIAGLSDHTLQTPWDSFIDSTRHFGWWQVAPATLAGAPQQLTPDDLPICLGPGIN